MQDGEKKLVVYQKLDVTGWYLLASIQYQSITRTSDNVLRIIWSFILPISILMSVVFAVAISNQIRKPVNELSERVGSVDIENYEYAEKDYGVDVINRLGEQFEESFGKIKELIEKVYIAEIRQKMHNMKFCRNR